MHPRRLRLRPVTLIGLRCPAKTFSPNGFTWDLIFCFFCIKTKEEKDKLKKEQKTEEIQILPILYFRKFSIFVETKFAYSMKKSIFLFTALLALAACSGKEKSGDDEVVSSVVAGG